MRDRNLKFRSKIEFIFLRTKIVIMQNFEPILDSPRPPMRFPKGRHFHLYEGVEILFAFGARCRLARREGIPDWSSCVYVCASFCVCVYARKPRGAFFVFCASSSDPGSAGASPFEWVSSSSSFPS